MPSEQTTLGAPLNPPRPQPIEWPKWESSDWLMDKLAEIERAVIRNPDDPRLKGIILR
jgi:hypothetical protein